MRYAILYAGLALLLAGCSSSGSSPSDNQMVGTYEMRDVVDGKLYYEMTLTETGTQVTGEGQYFPENAPWDDSLSRDVSVKGKHESQELTLTIQHARDTLRGDGPTGGNTQKIEEIEFRSVGGEHVTRGTFMLMRK